jgi:hypothetical protein
MQPPKRERRAPMRLSVVEDLEDEDDELQEPQEEAEGAAAASPEPPAKRGRRTAPRAARGPAAPPLPPPRPAAVLLQMLGWTSFIDALTARDGLRTSALVCGDVAPLAVAIAARQAQVEPAWRAAAAALLEPPSAPGAPFAAALAPLAMRATVNRADATRIKLGDAKERFRLADAEVKALPRQRGKVGYREIDVRRLAAAKWGSAARLEAARAEAEAKAAATAAARRANEEARAAREGEAAGALLAAGVHASYVHGDVGMAAWIRTGKGELGGHVERLAEAERAAREATAARIQAAREAAAARVEEARRAAEARRAVRLAAVVAGLAAAGVAEEEAHALLLAQAPSLDFARHVSGVPGLNAEQAAGRIMLQRDAEAAIAARGLSFSNVAALPDVWQRVTAFVGLRGAAASAAALAEDVAAAYPAAERAHRRAAALAAALAAAPAPPRRSSRCSARGCRNTASAMCPSGVCGVHCGQCRKKGCPKHPGGRKRRG